MHIHINTLKHMPELIIHFSLKQNCFIIELLTSLRGDKA